MSSTIRIRLETLKKLHELRRYPSETLDSVIQRLIANYLGEEEPPIVLWGNINKQRPVIRVKPRKLHARSRISRKCRTFQSENPHRLRFY